MFQFSSFFSICEILKVCQKVKLLLINPVYLNELSAIAYFFLLVQETLLVSHKAEALFDRIFELEGDRIHTGQLLRNLETGLTNRYLRRFYFYYYLIIFLYSAGAGWSGQGSFLSFPRKSARGIC